MIRLALLLCALALPVAASAGPLTIAMGESWAFSVKDGQPVGERRIRANAKPGRGEIKATVTGIGGTTMTLTNNSATGYTFRAQLVGAPSVRPARTCTLPAGMKPVLEYWPQRAKAVRIGDFRPSKGAGSCPPGS